MLGYILLILGVVYVVRLFTIAPEKPEMYPALPAGVFMKWKNTECLSIYIFLFATWGVNLVYFIARLAADTPEAVDQYLPLFWGAFAALLVTSAIIGTSSAKIKKQYKAQWVKCVMTMAQQYAPYPPQQMGYPQQAVAPRPQAQPQPSPMQAPPVTSATTTMQYPSSAATIEAPAGQDWQCRCGNVNSASDTQCRKCKRSVDAVI